jgi:hypothetical protein
MKELCQDGESAAAEVNRLHGEICDTARTTVEKAIRIGQLLAEQKGHLKHGEWLPWLDANVTFTDRTARNYLRVFENREQLKLENVSDLAGAYAAMLPQKAAESLQAAPPDEADIIVPFDKAAWEKSAPVASSGDSESEHEGRKPRATYVPGEGLTLRSRVDDLCGSASTNAGAISIRLAATAGSRIATTDDPIITGSSKLKDLCAKWLKEHGDEKIDEMLTIVPIKGWVVMVWPSTDEEAWIFNARRWTAAPEWIRKTLKSTDRYRR